MANMNLNDWYTYVPEFQNEGYWSVDIIDGTSTINKSKLVRCINSIKFSDYVSHDNIDFYIQSVNIPQMNLEFETNSYGLTSFKEKSPYDDVTINFYDDVKASLISFFTDWMHCIYDESNNCVCANWRYETKDIKLKYYKILSNSLINTISYTAKRCLPKSISEISADENAGDRKQYSVVLQCQKIINESDKIKIKTSHNSELDSEIQIPSAKQTKTKTKEQFSWTSQDNTNKVNRWWEY